MQVILGSGGTIGRELASALTAYTKDIRLVSRNPEKVNPGDILLPTDLNMRENVFKAVEGASVVYLTVGFKYDLKVWQAQWPTLMRNVIDACKQHKAKLVFFDNIYMYDPEHLGHMTESTPINPSSLKGKVRAEIATLLTREFDKGELSALIARSADFYGPHNKNSSVLIELVYKNLAKGKAANWLIDADKVHSFTYTPDAARATAMLGNTDAAFGQVWHLPTDGTKLTGRQWIELFAKEMHAKAKVQLLRQWMLTLLGIFVPVLREMKEMTYQYNRDYFFDSSKFNQHFNFKPTTPEEGVKQTVANP